MIFDCIFVDHRTPILYLATPPKTPPVPKFNQASVLYKSGRWRSAMASQDNLHAVFVQRNMVLPIEPGFRTRT